ncbi:hypothetical protein BJ122_102207 [Rhodopseudomonas faecalis]|uniref:Uncharacterized protein n=1 Tax=Rhodopseudomonas faecalis TaxID=99655 RepID=A0A318TJC9_9BRAD|nr:hypothetical protein [Rhodopseudomonas faecalis]PYF04981.1 hypothetical protein BJ122_102207 [Rhodopseudomonas faecalis]
MKKPRPLTRRERHILALLYPDKSLAVGLSICAELYARKLITIDRFRRRYVLTEAGRAALSQQELTL